MLVGGGKSVQFVAILLVVAGLVGIWKNSLGWVCGGLWFMVCVTLNHPVVTGERSGRGRPGSYLERGFEWGRNLVEAVGYAL